MISGIPSFGRAQVVGWPPIKSFRKNSLATTSKNTEEVDGKAGPGALFIKVSMDGAPYLRKVDLRNYSAYQELSSALEKMFSCFTIGEQNKIFDLICRMWLVDIVIILSVELVFYSGNVLCLFMDRVTATLL